MKLYFTIIFIFCGFHSIAQTINGIVRDKDRKDPVEDATISIEQLNIHSHSDALGNFNFTSIKAGTYSIVINKIGYDRQKINVTIAEGETKLLDVSLIYHPIGLSSVDVATDRPVSAASSKYLSDIDFDIRPKNSAQDMLRLVPGLFIAQHAGGGKAEQIFIRGFDCDHGTDVATYVDGIPVNMPSHGHGQGYEDLHFLIPETVKGMKIFKGPYSPLYGDFATGAAVEFNTLDSLENNLIQIESGYVPEAESITSNRILAMLKLPFISSKVNSYFAAEGLNNRGYFDASQDFHRVNLFSKTTFTVTDHSNIHFSFSGFGSNWNASGQIPERAVKEEIISRFGSIDDSEGGTTQRNNINLVYHTHVGVSEFETQVYSSNYRFRLFSNFTFYLEDPVNGDEIEQDDNRSIQGINSHYSFGHKLGSLNNKFTLGLNYRTDKIENQLWQTVDRTRLEARAIANINESSIGIYANEVFRFSDKFRIELGARFDYFIFDVEDLLPTDSTHINYSGYNYQTLLSPKINLIYTPNDHLQLFLNSGSGFHSNDARSVVQQPNVHALPRAPGAEIGTLIHLNKLVTSIAFWWMDMENELVYVGDDGTTEDKGSSRRTGIDVSMRYQIKTWIFADADFNFSKGRFTDKLYGSELKTDIYVPLAPVVTSSGGLTANLNKKIEVGLRYRFIADRPANETNTVVAHGYNLIDFSMNYKMKHFKIGLIIENLLNTEWNEAQFDTESRLFNESQSVEELHFTPGTPLYGKIIVGYNF